MSGGDRREGSQNLGRLEVGFLVVLGILAGLSVAMFFFVWGFPWFVEPNQYTSPNYPNPPYNGHSENQGDNTHYWMRGLRGVIYFEDSLAQWFMSGFAAIATIASLYAVWLLKGTFVATKETLKQARIATQHAENTNKISMQQFEQRSLPFFEIKLKGPIIPERIVMQRSHPDFGGACYLPYIGEFEITNISDNPCTVIGYAVGLIERDDFASLEDVFMEFGAGEAITLPHNQRWGAEDGTDEEFSMISGFQITAEERMNIGFELPGIVGKFVYLDINGNTRIHSFAYSVRRMWKPTVERWGGRRHNFDIKADINYYHGNELRNVRIRDLTLPDEINTP